MNDNFWNRVLDLLDRQGVSRKEFAMRVGVSYSSIHNGAMLNSVPSADIALRIAYELHTSIEYLVYGSEHFYDTDVAMLTDQSRNLVRYSYEKNKHLLTALSNMQPEVRESVEDLIFTLEKVNGSPQTAQK
ncbi:MAG: helix-turn-helix transcriptional regulator [Treponema sp.]|nr:helix-turn-helix transcriptional regulator [Treponema sp.]